MKIKFTIHGNLASKANSRRMVISPRTGKPLFIKSMAAIVFCQDFRKQCPMRVKVGLKTPVKLTVTVYYKTRRNDLDVGIVMDCLEREGVIKNDRQVEEIHAFKRWDKDNPRVEIELEEK
jgi:Holliday junction resolvase RusA-like endonuclease